MHIGPRLAWRRGSCTSDDVPPTGLTHRREPHAHPHPPACCRHHLRAGCNEASVYQGKCALPTNFDLGQARRRTNLRIDWTADGGRWGLGGFVNNMFDKLYVSVLGTISQPPLGTLYAYVTPQRTWRVEARYKL